MKQLTMAVIGLLSLVVCQSPGFAQVFGDVATDELIVKLSDKEVQTRRDAVYELARRGLREPSIIDAYIAALNDQDVQVRIQALIALGRMGDQALPSLEALMDCLKDRDNQVRYRAAAAIGNIGAPALPLLQTALADSNSQLKGSAARAATWMGSRAQSLVEALEQNLTDRIADTRKATAEAIVAVDAHNEATLLKVAGHEDPIVRHIGISALAALEDPSLESVQLLRKAAQDSDARIRETAILMIAKSPVSKYHKAAMIENALKDQAETVQSAGVAAIRIAHLDDAEFAKVLAGLLADASEANRSVAARAIAAIGPVAVDTLPDLMKCAQEHTVPDDIIVTALASFGKDSITRLLTELRRTPANESIVSRTLSSMGDQAMERMIQSLRDDHEIVRVAVARAIGGTTSPQRKILEPLAELLDDPSPKVRTVVVQSMIAASKDTQFAKARMLKAMSDSDVVLRSNAVLGVLKFGLTPEETAQVISASLDDSHAEVKANILTAIQERPGLVKKYLTQIVAAKDDPSAEVRAAAMEAIGNVEKDSADDTIRAALAAAIQDKDNSVRLKALGAIEKIGGASEPVIAGLQANLSVDDPQLKLAALKTAAVLGSDAVPLAPLASQLRDEPRADVRTAALQAIAAIEPDVDTQISHFEKGLDDKDWDVRRTSAELLGKMGSKAKSAVPKLMGVLKVDGDSDYASAALREIDAAPIESLPLLIESLKSDNQRTVTFAILLLRRLGPDAKEALPILEEMMAKQGGRGGGGGSRGGGLRQTIAAIKGEEVRGPTRGPARGAARGPAR